MSLACRTTQLSTDLNAPERRQLPRKKVFLSGVLADLTGENALECAIQDMHARGAEVAVPAKLPVGAPIYLLDTGNRTAHLARVAWSGSNRCGLSFVRSYTMGLALPPRMRVLWRLFLVAKLHQVERAVEKGVPVKLALSTAGLALEHLHQMARYASSDKRLGPLLHKAKRLFAE